MSLKLPAEVPALLADCICASMPCRSASSEALAVSVLGCDVAVACDGLCVCEVAGWLVGAVGADEPLFERYHQRAATRIITTTPQRSVFDMRWILMN